MRQMSLFDGSQPFKITKPIRLIELFAGIGAQAKALENLGVSFEHYRVVEIDKYAIASYNAIYSTNFTTSDITQITAEDLEIVDTDKYCYIMTYSYPCTSISTAGKGNGMAKNSGTASSLIWEVERLLRELKEQGNLPEVLLMENVPQVISEKNIKDFAEWLSFLDGLGYKSKYQVLNATDFNIPQNRSRFFMVSLLGDYLYEFPKAQKQTKTLFDIVTFDEKCKVNMNKLTQTQKNAIAKVATILGKDKASKTVRASGESSYDRHTWNIYGCNLGQSDSFTTIIKDKSQSLKVATTNDGYMLENGRQEVYYTYNALERFTLMGFTDNDYEKAAAVCCQTQLYNQAGNSIVVQVLMAIFEKMI